MPDIELFMSFRDCSDYSGLVTVRATDNVEQFLNLTDLNKHLLKTFETAIG